MSSFFSSELSRLPTSQQIVQAMTHLRHEDGHPRTLVAVVEREFHLIALGVERSDVVVKLVARDEEALQFPFDAHEEHAFHLVHILIQVDDVSFVIRDKFRHFRDDTLLIRAVQ